MHTRHQQSMTFFLQCGFLSEIHYGRWSSESPEPRAPYRQSLNVQQLPQRMLSLCCFNSSSWSSMLPTRIRAEKRQLKHLVSDIFRSIGCSSWLGMAFFRCLGWTNMSGSDCNGSKTYWYQSKKYGPRWTGAAWPVLPQEIWKRLTVAPRNIIS